MENTSSPGPAERIAQTAHQIYEEKYKEQCENEHKGKFVVIDITDEQMYVGKYAETVLQEARSASAYGIFHLIRVGFPGAFKVSHIFGKRALRMRVL